MNIIEARDRLTAIIEENERRGWANRNESELVIQVKVSKRRRDYYAITHAGSSWVGLENGRDYFELRTTDEPVAKYGVPEKRTNEPEPMPARCECEHVSHGAIYGCQGNATHRIVTAYGPYRVCDGCYDKGHMQPQDPHTRCACAWQLQAGCQWSAGDGRPNHFEPRTDMSRCQAPATFTCDHQR
jgi:hypothetical protein